MHFLGTVLPAGALALAALSFSPAARADDPPSMPPTPSDPAKPAPQSGRFFDTYDTNGDGRVTKEEFAAGKGDEDTFDLLDTNHDGAVSLEELGLPVDYKRTEKPREPEEGPGGMRNAEGFQKRLEEFKRNLKAWDTDGDGKITKEEYKGKAPFERLDRNKDGVLSMADAPGGGKGMPGEMLSPEQRAARFKEMDKNGDGKITKEEWPGRPEGFARIDKDGDGVVTPAEADAAMMLGGPGGPGGERPMMRFERFDKDKDGKLSREEFTGDDETFKGLDANGDGFLTPDEFEKAAGGKKPGKGPGGAGLPRMPPPPPGGDAMPPPPPTGDGTGAPPPPPTFSGLFAVMDKNKDGKISREEFRGDDAEWKALDKDGNGWITADEAR